MNNNTKLRKSISDFVNEYLAIEKSENKIAENSYCAPFWIGFLNAVFNERNFSKFLNFEKDVKDNNSTKRIDVYISQTKTIIEQKWGLFAKSSWDRGEGR